jgi:hypothetical protein
MRQQQQDPTTLVIRRALDADRPAVERLAQLDSAPTPSGELLVGEVDGVIRAALRLDDGVSVADPFWPSRELVELLDLRAARLRPAHRDTAGRVRSRLRLWAELVHASTWAHPAR